MMRKLSAKWTVLFLMLIALACQGYGSFKDGQFKHSTGFDYSSGYYDDPVKTEILYIPYSLAYRYGSFIGKLTVSWVSIDGPGFVDDGGVILPPGTVTDPERESGIGDTWVALTYEVDQLNHEWGYLDLTAKLKIPTADKEKRLGTGEADLNLQLDYFYPVDRLIPMLTLAYKIKGDPDEADLNNVWYFSAGADWRQHEKLHLGMTLDYQQATYNGGYDPLDLFSYLSYKVNQRFSLTPYLYVGLSRGSPDIGGGIQLSYKPESGGKHEEHD